MRARVCGPFVIGSVNNFGDNLIFPASDPVPPGMVASVRFAILLMNVFGEKLRKYIHHHD
ncbi:hypothetical protein CBM2633_A10151 [Cupriavidus taiwanensis]|nr:hypothetical protein CBM2633_A10151 [Cupriavidus taiwanensis]